MVCFSNGQLDKTFCQPASPTQSTLLLISITPQPRRNFIQILLEINLLASEALESALALLKTDVGGWGAQPALNSLEPRVSAIQLTAPCHFRVFIAYHVTNAFIFVSQKSIMTYQTSKNILRLRYHYCC